MKVKRTLALALLSLFTLLSLCALFGLVYVVAPANVQKSMRRFLKYEFAITRRNLRIIRLSVGNFFGRLSEQDLISLKRKEMTAKKGVFRRALLLLRRVVSTASRVFQSFFYTVRSIFRIGVFSLKSGVRFVWRQLERADTAIVAVLSRIVILLAKVERFLTFGIRFIVTKVELLIDLVYPDDAEAAH